jgi:hypothetical protein
MALGPYISLSLPEHGSVHDRRDESVAKDLMTDAGIRQVISLTTTPRWAVHE